MDIYQAYIDNKPIASLLCHRTIEGALESAMDIIKYECGPSKATVCKPVEIEKPHNYPYYISKVFRVKIIDEEFDEELGNWEVYYRHKYVLIKEMKLVD